MKKTVVMCTYNGELYLGKQLDSILNQTSKVDEILISDDVSSDNTRSILNDYEKRYPQIKVFYNDSNKGFIKNFFDTLYKANGDLIFLCDQDDLWLKDRVETIEKVFLKNNNIQCLNTAYKLIDENDNEINNIFAEKKLCLSSLKKIKFKNFIRSPRYPGMSMTIRKSLLNDMTLIDYDKISSHDWFINQYAAYKNSNYYLNRVLSLYRQHTNNTVGVVNNLDSNYLINQRMTRINSFEKAHKSLKIIYANNKIICSYADQILRLDNCRKQFIKGNNLFKLVFLFLKNVRRISFRCFLGDFLCITKKIVKK